MARLNNEGLVIRSRSQSDERVRLISLSDAGKKLRQAAEQVPDMMMCKSKMTSEELSSLKQACDLLLKNLTAAD